MDRLEIYIDGASQGNPGPSGIGVVINENGRTVKNIAQFIGRTTNNVAEYTALIFGLQAALILKSDTVKVNTDSQLLYRQLNKTYRVKHPNIVGPYQQVLQLISAFKEVSFRLIPREQNRQADKLATKAIKDELKKKTQSSGAKLPARFLE